MRNLRIGIFFFMSEAKSLVMFLLQTLSTREEILLKYAPVLFLTL